MSLLNSAALLLAAVTSPTPADVTASVGFTTNLLVLSQQDPATARAESNLAALTAPSSSAANANPLFAEIAGFVLKTGGSSAKFARAQNPNDATDTVANKFGWSEAAGSYMYDKFNAKQVGDTDKLVIYHTATGAADKPRLEIVLSNWMTADYMSALKAAFGPNGTDQQKTNVLMDCGAKASVMVWSTTGSKPVTGTPENAVADKFNKAVGLGASTQNRNIFAMAR